MPKTITVTGTGSVDAAPDYTVVSIGLETREKDYAKALDKAGKKIERLNSALEAIGFEKNAAKTASFNVTADYISVHTENGGYERVFNGYICNHRLKIEFDFNQKLLAEVLSAASQSLTQPEISISFTVKDFAKVNENALKAAAQNAEAKAKILCEASGVKLGELLSIDYTHGGANDLSPTDYRLEAVCLAAPRAKAVNIAPENITVTDTAKFVWAVG